MSHESKPDLPIEASSVLFTRTGEISPQAADIDFMQGPDGSVGMSTHQLMKLVGLMGTKGMVWIRPGQPYGVSSVDNAEHTQEAPEPFIFFGGAVRLERARRELYVSDKLVEVARKEYELLDYLMRHSGVVQRRSQIFETVWGQTIGDQRTIDIHVRRCRGRLEEYKDALVTCRGVGYFWNPNFTVEAQEQA